MGECFLLMGRKKHLYVLCICRIALLSIWKQNFGFSSVLSSRKPPSDAGSVMAWTCLVANSTGSFVFIEFRKSVSPPPVTTHRTISDHHYWELMLVSCLQVRMLTKCSCLARTKFLTSKYIIFSQSVIISVHTWVPGLCWSLSQMFILLYEPDVCCYHPDLGESSFI